MTSCRYVNNFAQLMDQLQMAVYDQCHENLVSKQSIRRRVVACILRELDMTFGDVCHLIQTHTPVHPEVVELMKPLCVKQDYYKNILAQEFIENEKLVKTMKHLCKNGHVGTVHYLLAMDGMGGNKLNLQGPHVDIKRYIENLKFSLSGKQGLYDREKNDDLKRAHVFAVRQVYTMLPDKQQSAHNVYCVLKTVLQEQGVIGDASRVSHNLDDKTLKACVATYKKEMSEMMDDVMAWFQNRIIVKPSPLAVTSEDDEEEEEEQESPPTKKQKMDSPPPKARLITKPLKK